MKHLHLYYYKHYLHDKKIMKSFLFMEQIKRVLQILQLIQSSSEKLLLANVNRWFSKQKNVNKFM